MSVTDLLTRRRTRDPGRPVVPGYAVHGPVGFGAAGPTWGARDETGRAVVISFVRLPPGDRGAALLRRLAALRSTVHRHLPGVRDVVALEDGRCAMVTEEVPGPTLATVRTARGDLSPGAAGLVLAGLASAVGGLHEKGVIHGDVAPSNVILTAEGVPVLVDLVGDVTHEKGTPGFVAPERRVGAPASTAADVWSLAAVVRWASGDHPDVTRALADALSPDPRERPRAAELAARWTTLGEPEQVELPSVADLAQAGLRDRSATTQLATTRRARGRHRRQTGRRRAVAGAGAAVVAGLVATAGAATDWASGTEQVSDERAAAAVTALLAARDEALAAGDVRALRELTVPESTAAARDADLMRGFGDAGVRPDGLRTRVERVRLLDRDASLDGPWRAEVVTRQEEYVLRGAGEVDGTVVPGQEPRCTVLEIVGPRWQVADVAACPGDG
ncbi:protein kinase domain-containing protein [Georgenia alba]|uniref:non-specific serine/threonine protein kinase n=1 Tax=Georgenia alba TaxID=2233858 RepID=A0ABW2QC33_9MICO